MIDKPPEDPFEKDPVGETLKSLQARYAKGEKGALARTILQCASLDLPLPTWAANAFIAAFAGLIKGERRSWDDVLGRPHPKGRHLAAVKLELRAHEIYSRIRELHENEGVPIDNKLFDRVGLELGVGGKTTVARLYARVRHSITGLREI